jgi:iron complex outermembrane receptor protein
VQNVSSVTVQAEAGYVASDSTVATKTDTPLLETPQSISVITRDLMDSQAPQSINEVLRYAPGIVPESQGTVSSFWNSSSLQLRGFSPDLYQDGLADDATGNTLLDAYFYQNIEILEGPSSTLYGQGSLAGIVNVETKRPRASAFHELQFGTGTYGRYEGNFDLSGPLGTPHLLYRLTGVAFSEGSQTWFIHPERYAIAPALSWLPDSKTSLTLLSNYTYNPNVGAYANVPALGSALYNPNGKIAPGFFGGDPNFNMTKQSFIQAGDVFNRTFGDGWRLEQNFRFTGNRDYAKMIWPEDLESDNETLDRYTFIRHVSFNSILSDQRLVKVLQQASCDRRCWGRQHAALPRGLELGQWRHRSHQCLSSGLLPADHYPNDNRQRVLSGRPDRHLLSGPGIARPIAAVLRRAPGLALNTSPKPVCRSRPN